MIASVGYTADQAKSSSAVDVLARREEVEVIAGFHQWEPPIEILACRLVNLHFRLSATMMKSGS